jgi:dihydrofolate reductase
VEDQGRLDKLPVLLSVDSGYPHSHGDTSRILFEVQVLMRVNIIVAYDKNRVIGAGGMIPWRLPEDMKHFKETTMGCPVIMGRKTWDSFPEKFKPLPGRFNIVITSRPIDYRGKYDEKDVRFTWSPTAAIMAAYARAAIGNTEVFIIGGSSIYKEYLDMGVVERILASEVKGDYSGDVHFPEFDPQSWDFTIKQRHADFDVVEYIKRKGNV